MYYQYTCNQCGADEEQESYCGSYKCSSCEKGNMLFVEEFNREARSKSIIRMRQLCFTDKTLYGVDHHGYVWYVDLKTGKWALHGNPTYIDFKQLSKEINES